MTSYTRDGTVGPWASEKLECLEKYLLAYTTILRKQDWCRGYFYIDAFAGSGRAELRRTQPSTNANAQPLFNDLASLESDGEATTYINGSPKVALELEHPFTHYFFIEQKSERVSALRSLQNEYRDTREISILQGDAGEELERTFLSGDIDWNIHRGVVFLDPFGLQVMWNTIVSLAETKALEVIINFPVGMAIQRLLPRSGAMSDNHRSLLTNYFGAADWYDVIYQKTSDLFDSQQIAKAEDSGRRLALWYQSRLKELFGYGAAPRLIRNSQGGHLYYLLFAGPNQTGAKIAQHILRQGETVR